MSTTSQDQNSTLLDKEIDQLTQSIQTMKVQDASLFLKRAQVYEKRQQYDKAFLDLRIALSFNPSDKDAIESLQKLVSSTKQVREDTHGVVVGSISSLLESALGCEELVNGDGEVDDLKKKKRDDAARVLAGSSSHQPEMSDYIAKEPKWVSLIMESILSEQESETDSSKLSYRFSLLQLFTNLSSIPSLQPLCLDVLKTHASEIPTFLGEKDSTSIHIAATAISNICLRAIKNPSEEPDTSFVHDILKHITVSYTDLSRSQVIRSTYQQALVKLLGRVEFVRMFLSLPEYKELLYTISKASFQETSQSSSTREEAPTLLIRLLAHVFIQLDLSTETDKTFCNTMFQYVSDLFYRSSTDRENESIALVAFSILFQANPEVGSLIFLDRQGWLDRLFDSLELFLNQVTGKKEVRLSININIVLEYALQGLSIACNVPTVRKQVVESKKWIPLLLSMTNTTSKKSSPSDSNNNSTHVSESVKSIASLILVKLLSHDKDLIPHLLENETILNVFLDHVKRGAAALPSPESETRSSSGSGKVETIPDKTTWTALTSAIESLAYLSVIGKIKERMVQDKDLILALGRIAAHPDRATQYGIAAIVSNVTAYRKPLSEEERQMKKLQELSAGKGGKSGGGGGGAGGGGNEEEEDPLNSDDAVAKRVTKLVVDQGILETLVKPLLKQSTSPHIRESIASCLVSVTTQQNLRGAVLKSIGVRPLLFLATAANDASSPTSSSTTSTMTTETGRLFAAHALAKIAITTDPTIAFPGETSLDAIRPLALLLNPEHHSSHHQVGHQTSQREPIQQVLLRQFESLMALTNLVSISDGHRSRFLSLEAPTLSWVEQLQIMENKLIRRAATEFLCNMVFHPKVTEMYLDPTSTHHRIQLIWALSDPLVEDIQTRRAASGTLAILSSVGGPALPALFERDPKRCTQILLDLLKEGDPQRPHPQFDLVHRGLEIVKNLVRADESKKQCRVAETFFKAGMVPLIKDLAKRLFLKQAQTGNSKRDPMELVLLEAVKETLVAFRSQGFE